MKSYLVLILAILQVASQAFAEDPVERFIKSDMPLIIDGNWLCPQNGGYTLVMTDEYMTVNGYVYVHPEDKTLGELEPPSKEKDFFDWVIRSTAEKAQKIVNDGGSKDDARAYMETVFATHVGKQGFIKYEIDRVNHFKLYHEDLPRGVGVSVPTTPFRDGEKPTYRERVIERRFKELAYYLDEGYLVMRGTLKSRFWAFPGEQAVQIERELRAIPAKPKTSIVMGESRYQRITIAARYELTHWDIEVLVNPRKLERR